MATAAPAAEDAGNRALVEADGNTVKPSNDVDLPATAQAEAKAKKQDGAGAQAAAEGPTAATAPSGAPEGDSHEPGTKGADPSADPSGPAPHAAPVSNAAGGEGSQQHSNSLKDKLAAEKNKLTGAKERIRDNTKPPGGFDATPLPHRDPGYTLKFTFHRATGLPVADIAASSSDPFLTATLTADLPTRNAEDPVMVHRTRTVHGSTEPEWNEDWIVANVPASGFRLKCHLYDEDASDHDDRLGNVTVEIAHISHDWTGLDHAPFDVKKRMGSKRAYVLKAAASLLHGGAYSKPTLELSIQVLGRSEPPGSRMYTIGPTTWVRHFSPMIGRLTHTRVNKDEREDENAAEAARSSSDRKSDRQTKKYDFQASEIQLQGPVPEKLYHRYVEFRPFISRMFTGHGVRGRILNVALHKQHNRVYNFSRTTEYGTFAPCSEAASLQFLKLAHFDEGGRIFTYMLSLDGVFRFTETGKEFGIDMLSKHTMHSDVATYIAFSGEFFIRRLSRPTDHAAEPDPPVATHPKDALPGGPPFSPPPHTPGFYQLVIDNDSGTYRPDKALLPLLKAFLEHNLPGLGVVAMHWEDKTLQKMKTDQHKTKKREGAGVQMVLDRSPTASSFSSSDESRLSSLGRASDADETEAEGAEAEGKPSAQTHHHHHMTKKELAWELLEDPSRIKDLHSTMLGHNHHGEGGAESSKHAK